MSRIDTLRRRKTKLTRADMEAKIKAGESIIHNGMVISAIVDLPTDVELAAGDPAAEQETADSLDAEIARLQTLRTRLADQQKQTAANIAAADAEAKAKAAAEPPASDADADAKRAQILAGNASGATKVELNPGPPQPPAGSTTGK